MLRSILTRAMNSRRRTTGTGGPTRPTAGRPTAGRPGTGGTANADIERGARSLLSGLGRKRRGL